MLIALCQLKVENIEKATGGKKSSKLSSFLIEFGISPKSRLQGGTGFDDGILSLEGCAKRFWGRRIQI